jgi:hypothetical protein
MERCFLKAESDERHGNPRRHPICIYSASRLPHLSGGLYADNGPSQFFRHGQLIEEGVI